MILITTLIIKLKLDKFTRIDSLKQKVLTLFMSLYLQFFRILIENWPFSGVHLLIYSQSGSFYMCIFDVRAYISQPQAEIEYVHCFIHHVGESCLGLLKAIGNTSSVANSQAERAGVRGTTSASSQWPIESITWGSFSPTYFIRIFLYLRLQTAFA